MVVVVLVVEWARSTTVVLVQSESVQTRTSTTNAGVRHCHWQCDGHAVVCVCLWHHALPVATSSGGGQLQVQQLEVEVQLELVVPCRVELEGSTSS